MHQVDFLNVSMMWQPNADDPYHSGPFFENLSIHGAVEEIGDIQPDTSTENPYYYQGGFVGNSDDPSMR